MKAHEIHGQMTKEMSDAAGRIQDPALRAAAEDFVKEHVAAEEALGLDDEVEAYDALRPLVVALGELKRVGLAHPDQSHADHRHAKSLVHSAFRVVATALPERLEAMGH